MRYSACGNSQPTATNCWWQIVLAWCPCSLPGSPGRNCSLPGWRPRQSGAWALPGDFSASPRHMRACRSTISSCSWGRASSSSAGRHSWLNKGDSWGRGAARFSSGSLPSCCSPTTTIQWPRTTIMRFALALSAPAILPANFWWRDCWPSAPRSTSGFGPRRGFGGLTC